MSVQKGWMRMASEEPDYSHEMVANELNRILTSRAFAQSRRLSRLISLVVGKMLAGDSAISEYVLGVGAFDRDESFDPRVDPIVRVCVHKLRVRLREYYDNEGARNPLEIVLPVRSYVPVIRRREVRDRPGAERSEWGAPSQAAKSVAVLPFATLSSDKQDEYFADGLTQELIHALAKVPDLRIVIWAAATQPGWRPEMRDLARGRNVQGILMGTLRRLEGQVRISVQLVSAADGSIIWSGMLESERGCAITTQERMAKAISEAVRARVGSQVSAPAA